MRTIKMILFFMSLNLAFAFNSNAQEVLETDWKKLSKKEKRALRKQKEAEKIKEYIALLESGKWVIEAHTLYDRYHQAYPLDPSINFVAVNDDKGAIQLGFNGLIGWNGVGGVTIVGDVTGYTIFEEKGEQVPRARINFHGRGTGSATIVLSINSAGQTTVNINGNFGRRFSFAGIIVPMDDTVVYEGQALF